jgi:hypothetical protein
MRLLKRFLPGSGTTTQRQQLIYAELIEALQQRGCALCGLAQSKSARYIDTLLTEAIMDVEQRDAWRAVKGLCHWHAWMAAASPQSSSSLAILYDDLLHHEATLLAQLTAAPSAARWHRLRMGSRMAQHVRRWLHAWRQPRTCPACHLWQDHERLCLTVLLDAWPDQELSATFARSDGLCLPHTARLIAHGATHPHLSAILAAQQVHWQTLQGDLREFLRKQDYRYAHESFGREADAWQRVIALFVGTRRKAREGERGRGGEGARNC